MLAILKRELRAYIYSPVGYVFIAVCLLTSGLFFYVSALSNGTTDLSPVFELMFYVMLIIIPMLTMRLMADEKRLKTDQLLLTSPINLFGLVMGKFLSAFIIFIIGTFVIPCYGIVLSFFTEMPWQTLWGNYIGLVLLGGVFISVGLLVSTFTENQMIAAVIGVAFNLILFLINYLASLIPIKFLADIILSLSVYNRYNPFRLGIFSFANVFYLLSMIFVFLFITVRVIDKRRWS